MISIPSLLDFGSIVLLSRRTYVDKAFLHVHLDKDDRDFTSFLWLSDPCDLSSLFMIFISLVVLFGATFSSFMLQATLTYHLTSDASSVSQDLLRNLYVDNVVSGSQTETTSLDYFAKSRSILNTANFNLQSWTSNNAQLMNTAKHQVADTANPVKVLGLWWDNHSDLIYSSHIPISSLTTTAITTRNTLKWASTIFYPLGLVSPVTIVAKLFLQTLCNNALLGTPIWVRNLSKCGTKSPLIAYKPQHYHFLDNVPPHHQHSQPCMSLQMPAFERMVQLYIYSKGPAAHY